MCGSGQTASVQVAKARETTSGKFGGLGINTSGEAGVFGGATTSTSAFGRSLAPPGEIYQQRSTSGPLVIATLAGITSMIAYVMYSAARTSERGTPRAVAIASAAAFLCCLIWYVINLRFNSESRRAMSSVNDKRLSEWASSWVCYQCGYRFDPNDAKLVKPHNS